MTPPPSQEGFCGNPEDLAAFLELACSPIRSEARTKALAAWRHYKQAKLLQRWPEVAEASFGATPAPLVIVKGGGLSSADGGIACQAMPPRAPALHKGWNMLAIKHHLIDLSGARLDGICLGYVDLRGVKLDGASLRGAWLKGAELEWASLRDADLSPLIVDGVDRATRLLQADLSHADLRDANLESADLSDSTLRNADLGGARLGRADLTRANLVGARLEGTTLTGSRIYGIAAWDISLCADAGRRQDLIITRPDEEDVRVDDIEVAQFVYLLLNRRKLRNVIDAVTQRGVLLLGRFSGGGLEQLQSIAAWLRKTGNGGYLPLLFDFPRPQSKTYTETIRTLAGLARFVIVDLSGPSVPQEITASVDLHEIPYVAILEQGRKDWSMFRDFLVKERVLGPVRFTGQDHLLGRLAEEVVSPAERWIARRQQRLDQVFGRSAPDEGSGSG